MLFVGSYNTRCMTAVSSFNFGPKYMRRLFKQATKESPGKFTKRYISKLSKQRCYSRSTPKQRLHFDKKNKTFAEPDTDYGDLCSELGCVELKLTTEEVEEKKIKFLTTLTKSLKEIYEVERATIDQVGST